jgi:copper chaperone CopZ
MTRENLATSTFQVQGMSCDGCAQRLKRVLECAEGVKDAEVSFGDRTTKVTYDRRQQTADTIERTIREAGFEPRLAP